MNRWVGPVSASALLLLMIPSFSVSQQGPAGRGDSLVYIVSVGEF